MVEQLREKIEQRLAELARPADEQIMQAGDAARVCKQIVTATALTIRGRRYVRVEGWQSIAVAHGTVASISAVEVIAGGIRATAELRRMSDGVVLCAAEGFVGDDESLWADRPLYARRAMAQTRAISRVCRSAFAHVVVMMQAGLETTPAEEVLHEADAPRTPSESGKAPVRHHTPTPAPDIGNPARPMSDPDTPEAKAEAAALFPSPQDDERRVLLAEIQAAGAKLSKIQRGRIKAMFLGDAEADLTRADVAALEAILKHLRETE